MSNIDIQCPDCGKWSSLDAISYSSCSIPSMYSLSEFRDFVNDTDVKVECPICQEYTLLRYYNFN
jgi:endogenous inhibitor of DNA gyrase (YacG/DUF329 family)